VTERTPPKLAAALLRWLGPHGPAFAGDLLEGYQSGQSRWWYWRQVITAVAIAAWCDCRGRKAWGVGATGLLLVFAGDTLAAPFRSWLLYRVMQPAAWSYPVVAAHPFIVLWTIDVTPLAIAALLSGWLFGLMIRPPRGVLIVLASLVFVGLATRSLMAVIALFDNQKHIPLHYFALFVVTETVLVTMLVVVGGLRRDTLRSRWMNHA